ncbi:MAG: alpha-hydroxy-acid oxidizing protein [Acidimicrobiia bacterium]|nr:alpha-hydroxy-acid oxidizing protein [Acidimicrobiia bacterium]
MEPALFEYYAGGSADNLTLRDNRTAFERLRLNPRVLVDVSAVDPSVEVLGHRESMPVMVAPTAMARLAHPDGELAIARAAARAGVTQVLSSLSTYSIEEVAGAGANTWFQLYVFKDRAISEHLVRRVEAAGYRALVLTVDLPVPGLRENLTRSGFDPSDLTMSNFTEVMKGHQEGGFFTYIHDNFDGSLTWDDVEWLHSITDLPMVVKGVLRADDAVRAVEAGVAGVLVSNHGGRQLDTAIAGIDALPAIAAAVDGRAAVFVDGGIRRGTDVVKALALGARAVLVGRPLLWGLAVGGESGAADVLAMLRAEVENAMALCGVPSVTDLPPDLVT